MARRVVQYFAEPHKVLEMSEEAKQLFLAYQAGWNVQGALQRQKKEGSGRLGTAAWHLAVTAAANLVLEIGAGDVAVEAGAPQLRIEFPSHHQGVQASVLIALAGFDFDREGTHDVKGFLFS